MYWPVARQAEEGMEYIGFVVDGMVPSLGNCLRRRVPQALIYGWGSGTAVATMRFRWIAEYVNQLSCGVHYELYRPWRPYRAVVFLKSMGPDSIALMQRLRKKGVATVFDVNVDYLSPTRGHFFYEGMAPTSVQRSAALTMVKEVDGVIGDSLHIADVVSAYAHDVVAIEDNVKSSSIKTQSSWAPARSERMTLLWSGQAIKLFELLAIKEVLLAWKEKIHLRCITNSREAMGRWFPGYKTEMEELLGQISHEFIPFTSLADLMRHYDEGGVFISPRFLDNSYNMGHTEWKITLAMARGRLALCSPQRSYVRVAELALGQGIRVCSDEQAWHKAFAEITSGAMDWPKEQAAAIAVVRDHYCTPEIAKRHLAFVKKMIDRGRG